MITTEEIERAFAWSTPKEIDTKRGTRLMRKADETPEALSYYQRNRSMLSAMGVVHGFKWKSETKREFTWWREMPSDVLVKRQESLERSMAIDTHLEVDMPEGMTLRGYQKAGVHFALDRKGTLIGDEPGLGKEQPVNMPVLTPSGWMPIGRLSVGDAVTGSDGRKQRVTGVFPQGQKRAYLVEFSDGSNVECGLEHLWLARNLNGTSRGRPFKVMTTRELNEKIGESWEIPLVRPVEFESQELPIPPYLLGVQIGDLEVPAEVEKGHPYAQWIPPCYLFSSVHDRMELLRGLMDTHGTANGSRIRYQTTSGKLADDVRHLIQSLGGLASVSTYCPRRTNEIPLHTICFAGVGNPFTNRAAPPPSLKIRRVIVKITPVDEVEQVCIQVSNPDHLYVTRDFILTHNTAQAIGVMNMRPQWRDILIVCPEKVRLNWLRELGRFSTVRRTIAMVEDGCVPSSEIVIIHFDVLWKRRLDLEKRLWDLVVIDEAHKLKDPKAKRTQAVFGLRPGRGEGKRTSGIPCRNRLALTGSPICNEPKDLFPILEWLDPVTWGNAYKFLNDYTGGLAKLASLQRKLRETVMIRRLKRDVLKELPPKNRQLVLLPASSDEAKAALRRERELLDTVNMDQMKDEQDVVAFMRSKIKVPFEEIARVRAETARAKLPMALEFVDDLLEETGEPVVIYAHHRDIIEKTVEHFRHRGALHLYGGMGSETAQQNITLFANNPRHQVFVLSIMAGGTGVDGLQKRCSTGVFFEDDWVPANVGQAEDRIHRWGQEGAANFYHLVLEGSLDCRVMTHVIQKQEIIDRSLNTSSVQELERMRVSAIQTTAYKAPAVRNEAELARPGLFGSKKRDVMVQLPEMTTEQREAVHAGLRFLAGNCDRAGVLDGQGFNKFDAGFGRQLAAAVCLSDRQALTGRSLCRKYVQQLGGALLARMG